MKKLVFLAVMVAASSYAADLYVDADNGDDANAGSDWGKAKKSIQAAIDASSAGDLILVNDGRYEPIFTSNKRIEIRSVNGPEATVIDGSLQWARGTTNRCATLGSYPTETNSVLSGFRLTNGITELYGGGSYAGTLKSCVLSGNTVTYYGGGSYGGALNDCVLSGNRAGAGGGSWGGILNRCILSGNTANQGGGSYAGTLNNCVLSGNTAANNGGGAHGGPMDGGSLNSCVLVGNKADYYGGGANEALLNNCVVWGNSAGWGHPAACNSSCQHCCLDEVVAGIGNISADPRFADPENGDYRLLSDSPCIDAGWTPWREDPGADLDGNPRWMGAQIDIGAYEYQQGSAPSSEPREPATWYVDAGNGSDSESGASPARAKKSIQAAVRISRDGDVILVAPGTYGPVATMDLRVRIASSDGPETTVIDGGGAIRCATLGTTANSVLEGFRLQNGSAYYGGGSFFGTLTNCVLSGNAAGRHGGGASHGTLNNCVLRGNTATENGGSGGGSYYGTLNNCLLSENAAVYGGGSYFEMLNNCTVARNRATAQGGGASKPVSLRNSIVWGNSSPDAADVFDRTTATYCCIPDQVPENGNIRDDPLFAAAENGDYRLRAGSPCIDAGRNYFAFGDTDLAGNPRIVGGRVDIGAYEGGVVGYDVTLDRQGGSGGTARVFATPGDAMPAIVVPTRGGYAFDGYYTETDGGGTPYYAADGASAREWDKEEATTLYAKWTAAPSPTLRWKYAKNANGWFCAQVAMPWYPGYSAELSNMRLLFADRFDEQGQITSYLVDPATVAAPLGSTETYRDVEYRAAPVDLSSFAGLAEGERAVFGVSDETMDSTLASVPKAERKICLRVVNRQITTVETLDDTIAWLVWEVGGRTNFLPLAAGWTPAQTMAATDAQYSAAPGGSAGTMAAGTAAAIRHSAVSLRHSVLPSPLSATELNLSESFGLPPAAVAKAKVTCRISTTEIGSDGSVTGTFDIAAKDAVRIVAESGEISDGVAFTVLGAASLAGPFAPLDPAACGVELLSRKAPYAFRVKAPGDNAFFKVLLAAEERYE